MKIPENDFVENLIEAYLPSTSASCPRCGQKEKPEGMFINEKIPVPASEILSVLPLPVYVKNWIKNIRITANLKYCPGCGFLKLKLGK
jgi:predicted RNA-binding Zn-ribbon protein involved in translation (DUF1610 family)